MAIQVFEQAAKGTRHCPALDGWITTLTCGKHRLNEIRCPSDCKHLGQHERYHHAKVADSFHQMWVDKVLPLYQRQDQVEIDLLLFLEFSLYRFLHQHPQTTDEDIVDGLKFTNRQLSPIQVVEAVGNAMGRHLVTAIAEYKKSQPKFDADRAQKLVDILITLFPKNPQENRQGVNGFMGHLEAHFDLSTLLKTEEDADITTSPKIITPNA